MAVTYIVPSIGRSGSSLVAWMIGHAVRQKVVFREDLHQPADGTQVLKTHSLYTGDPPYPYKAVFLWASVGDVIASMWQFGRTPSRPKLDKDQLAGHLKNLCVPAPARDRFWRLVNDDGDWTRAWLSLIEGDQLGFIENIETWNTCPHAYFVQYEELCLVPVYITRLISIFLGVDLKVPQIRDRNGWFEDLPALIQEAVWDVYGDLTVCEVLNEI